MRLLFILGLVMALSGWDWRDDGLMDIRDLNRQYEEQRHRRETERHNRQMEEYARKQNRLEQKRELDRIFRERLIQ